MQEEIFITGAGVVSALGRGKTAALNSLLAGRTGIVKSCQFGPSLPNIPIGNVKMDDQEMSMILGLNEDLVMTRTALMGRLALQEALEDASISACLSPEIHFVSSTSVGGMNLREDYHHYTTDDKKKSSIALYNFGDDTRMIAKPFGQFASLSTISTACSSATNAIIRGANLLRCGISDIVVAGGVDSLTRFHLSGFDKLMVIDHDLCKPFDKNRAGLNLGEGAAYIVLETAASAHRRGVRPYCRLSGYGNACDAYHQTASSKDGLGAIISMQKALEMANMHAEDIHYINAHGTGTLNNDESESNAIMHVFGENYPTISSTKSFTGHTTGASGSIEAVICMLALQHQFLPVNINWDTPMEHGVIPVTNSRPIQRIENVLSNAFGFGGNDSSIILSQI